MKPDLKKDINFYKTFGYLTALFSVYYMAKTKKFDTKLSLLVLVILFAFVTVFEDVYVIFKTKDETIKNNIVEKSVSSKFKTKQAKWLYVLLAGIIFFIWRDNSISKSDKYKLSIFTILAFAISILSVNNEIDEGYMGNKELAKGLANNTVLDVEVIGGALLLSLILAYVTKRSVKGTILFAVTGLTAGISISNLIKSNINFDDFYSFINDIIKYKKRTVKKMLIFLSKNQLKDYVNKESVNNETLNYIVENTPSEMINIVYDVYISNPEVFNENNSYNDILNLLSKKEDINKIDAFNQFLNKFLSMTGKKLLPDVIINRPIRQYKALKSGNFYKLNTNGILSEIGKSYKINDTFNFYEQWKFIKARVDNKVINPQVLLLSDGNGKYVFASDFSSN
jgi:hypothetical protein